MPQESKGKASAAAQRAHEKESKRARGALSCAECRRLKLKCDKSVPCSSCVRRGCGSICPNGELVTGGGTRFVLADTEQLHKKITEMGDRIQALEDALRISHSSQSSDGHPLLSRDLLSIKSALDLHSAVKKDSAASSPEEPEDIQSMDDAFGTLAIHADTGITAFYGRSSGVESLLINEQSQSSQATQNNARGDSSSQHRALGSIAQLSNTFPFGAPDYVSLEDLIENHLPPWDEVCHYSRLYSSMAPWFYNAISPNQLEEELLPMWYQEAPKSSIASPSTFQSGEPGSEHKGGGAHDLALLFMVMVYGALTDTQLAAPPDNDVADRYYRLTRAALTLESATDKPPSMATVQTLSMMGIYQGLCNGEHNIESMWAIFGLSTKLAQSIGLHRDTARWKLPPSETQKRRAFFWELFITDGWQSLSTGRLATFSLPFVDCELPQDKDQTLDENGNPMPSFPFWKARFGAECVSAIVHGTMTARAPKYSVIIELDRKVRDLELPKYAQGEAPRGRPLAETMSYFMPHNYRDLSLLYIHRRFFAHTLTSHPLDPLKSPYAPSFLAGYRSSCELITNVRQSFSMFPAEIARFWVLWTHAFSGAILLASVVTHAPKSKVAGAALLEIKVARDLFESAAKLGGRAVKFNPIIQRLVAKAETIYYETREGAVPPNTKDIFVPTKLEETPDELSIFSGNTNIVVTSAVPRAAPPVKMESPDSANATPPMPSFAGVHPGLIRDYKDFETDIDQRLLRAQSEDPSFSSYAPQPQPLHSSPPQSSMDGVPQYQVQSAYSTPPSSDYSRSQSSEMHSPQGIHHHPPSIPSHHMATMSANQDRYIMPVEYSEPYFIRQQHVQRRGVTQAESVPAPDIQYHYSNFIQNSNSSQHSLPQHLQHSQEQQMYDTTMVNSYQARAQSHDHYPSTTSVLEQGPSQANGYPPYGINSHDGYQQQQQPLQRANSRRHSQYPSLGHIYDSVQPVNDDPNMQATWNQYFTIPGIPEQR